MKQLRARSRRWLPGVVLLLAVGCSSPRFQGVQKLDERFDPALDAYVVRVQFEVLDGELPVQGLTASDFRISEDGVQSTSESVQTIDRNEEKLTVTLLLDTSYSIYHSQAIDALKRSANNFVSSLAGAGFQVQIEDFNREVGTFDSINAIPSSWDQREEGSRWTALYYAVDRALTEHPNNILVVFSDGADNYSQNYGIDGFDELEERIGGRQIHAVGFGAVRDEVDRQGKDARAVLRKLATNGTYEYAEDEAALEEIFDFISRRIRNIYVVDYFSPNHSGEHEITIRYKRAKTEPIPFVADTDVPDSVSALTAP